MKSTFEKKEIRVENLLGYVTHSIKNRKLINLSESLISEVKFNEKVKHEGEEMTGRIGHAVSPHPIDPDQYLYIFGGMIRGKMTNDLFLFDLKREELTKIEGSQHLSQLMFSTIHCISHTMNIYNRTLIKLKTIHNDKILVPKKKKDQKLKAQENYWGEYDRSKFREVVKETKTTLDYRNDITKKKKVVELQLIIIGGIDDTNEINDEMLILNMKGLRVVGSRKYKGLKLFMHKSVLLRKFPTYECQQQRSKRGRSNKLSNPTIDEEENWILVCGGIENAERGKISNRLFLISAQYKTYPQDVILKKLRLPKLFTRYYGDYKVAYKIAEGSCEYSFQTVYNVKEITDIENENEYQPSIGGGMLKNEDLIYLYGGYNGNKPAHCSRYIQVLDFGNKGKRHWKKKILVNQPAVENSPFLKIFNFDTSAFKISDSVMIYSRNFYLLKFQIGKLAEDNTGSISCLEGTHDKVGLSACYINRLKIYELGGGSLNNPEFWKSCLDNVGFIFEKFKSLLQNNEVFEKKNSVSVFERDLFADLKVEKLFFKSIVGWSQSKVKKNVIFRYSFKEGKSKNIYINKFFLNFYKEFQKLIIENGSKNNKGEIVIECNGENSILRKYKSKNFRKVLDFISSNCFVFSVKSFKDSDLKEIYEISKVFQLKLLEKLCSNELDISSLYDYCLFRRIKSKESFTGEFLKPRKLIQIREWKTCEYCNEYGIVQFVIRVPSFGGNDNDEELLKSPLSPCLYKTIDDIDVFDIFFEEEELDKELETEIRVEFDGFIEEDEDLREFYIIHAHKALLKYRSGYFRLMWPDKKEKEIEEEGEDENEKDEVFIERKTNRVRISEDELSLEGLHIILKYFYQNQIVNLKASSAVAVYLCCRKFELKNVFPSIRAIMKENIDLETTLPMLYIADIYGDKEILKFSTHYFAKNFRDILNDRQNKEYFDSFSFVTKGFMTQQILKSYSSDLSDFMKMKKMD